MKLLTLALFLAPAIAAPQSCYQTWQYLECSSNGPTNSIAATSSGGGSASWCTSFCNTNAPGAAYAGINTQYYNNQYYSSCRCGGYANPLPLVPAGTACYYPCAYSSKTQAQCQDGSCHCGGPRAYSIFQKVTVCV